MLVDLVLNAALGGAWVRVWPEGFDAERARHRRLDGGGAPVRATGEVTLVAEIPGGQIATTARLALDVLLVTREASRHYAGLRFERPAPAAGSAPAVNAAAGPFLICERGRVVPTEAGLRTPGQVSPGAVVVSLEDPPALVDPASLQSAHFTDEALLPRLDGGVSIGITEPAFRGAL